MASSLKKFKARALARADVREAYEALEPEFTFLDEVLKARAESGLTQAEVAERVGTTQSAIARLESGAMKHSPSIATLQKYAEALGYRVEVRFIKNRGVARAPTRARRDRGPRLAG
jgi:transcriptional regulator with XRE-family HTH domain